MAAQRKPVESFLKPVSTILPFGGEKGYINLDIGSSSIKMVEVGGQGSSLKVTNAGVIPLPLDAVQSNFVQDSGRVSQAIRTLIEENRLKSTDVITAVPGPAVIVKHVAFPIQDPAELEETILFEAGNFMQELGFDRDQAEGAKILGSLKGYEKDDIDRAISVTSEQLLDETQRALSFFWTGSTEEQISSVYLCGGTAQLPDLASTVSARLQVPVEVCNPFRLLKIGRHVDEDFIEHHASSLAVSVGLATRGPGDK